MVIERNNVHAPVREPESVNKGPVDVLAREPIERLREMGRTLGHDVPHRIIQLYLGDAPQRLANLRQSLTAGDVAAMEQAAHSLTGSSANLGALNFAGLCRDLEHRCQGALPPSAEQRLRALETEYERVEQAMRQLLTEFA